MACKEIFIDSTSTGNGRIVRNSDGSIKEMLTQHKKKSKLWDSINKSTDKEVLDTVDMVSGEASFDNELFALIKAQMGLEGNIAKDKKIEVLKLMLYAKAISENVLKEAPYKSEIDKGIAEPKLDVVKGKLQVILTAGVRVALRGNPQLFEGKAKLEYYKKLENNSAIWALDAMIKKDPRVIQSIIDDMAGSADASNISSQLLSAATDNAKELILGRIGSNEDTNGIITAMLLMGYELSTIIDFLDDADIKHVLEGMEIRRNGGDFATLSSSIVKELGDAGSDSINTLLRVFEVSESIMAFGGIRSLSENFKIDTVSIKRILEGIDVHNLRKAIKENDITMLYHAEGGMGNKVFNPELLIFLHPQSRMIFNRLYDLEYNMLPAMFPSIKPMDIFFEGFDARTEVAEKRLLDFIDSKKIGSFIKQKGLTGELPNPITGVVEYYDLSVTANRERYVQNFPAYIKKMRYDALTTFDSKIRPFKSPVLDSLSFYTGTNGAAPIVSIPGLGSKVHNDTYDSSIKAAYDELLIEIKDIDTPATLALKESLHSNLSLYALLTSNGRIRDRDMLSLMPEISTELAKHSKSLDESFYEEILHIVEVTEDIQNRLFRQATFRAKSNKSPAPTRQQMPEIGKKAMINKEFKDLVLGETPLFNVVAENVEKARAK
ncbi:MAG: hypothetical protein KAH32_07470, partial [Chlamydiia bacterium]|nr:hypothetical protein [Chlamydiia bacterium]